MDIFKILFAVLIGYIVWGISLNSGGLSRLPELIIWLSSFIFIFIPVFLISALFHKNKKPKDTNIETDEKPEDYADKRMREIEEAMKREFKL